MFVSLPTHATVHHVFHRLSHFPLATCQSPPSWFDWFQTLLLNCKISLCMVYFAPFGFVIATVWPVHVFDRVNCLCFQYLLKQLSGLDYWTNTTNLLVVFYLPHLDLLFYHVNLYTSLFSTSFAPIKILAVKIITICLTIRLSCWSPFPSTTKLTNSHGVSILSSCFSRLQNLPVFNPQQWILFFTSFAPKQDFSCEDNHNMSNYQINSLISISFYY